MKNKAMIRLVTLLMMVIFGSVLSGCGQKTVNLNKYVEIEISGYDTVGTAKISYDMEALRKDLKDRIKVNTKEMNELTAGLYGEMSSDDLVEMLLMTCVDGSFDKDSGLKNGDKVVWTWECDDEAAKKYFNCKLKCSDIKETVEGLKEATVFDPFEHVTVSYSGMDGSGTISLEKDNMPEVMSWISFRPSVADSLKNGDSVTLTVNAGTDVDALVEQFGMLPSPMEKTYTVEGLPSYLSSSEQITEDVLEKMKKQAEDSLIGSTSRSSWNKATVIDSYDYIGYYLITAKDSSTYDMKNEVYVVYKVNVSSTLTNYDTETDEDWSASYYYYLGFRDLMLLPDGTLAVDISDYDRPGTFRKDTGIPDHWYAAFDTQMLKFEGCAVLDDVHKEAIVSHIEYYNYEIKITEE